MPRKSYAPKNRFVKQSKFGESEFATLVCLYLEGKSAPQAREEYAGMDHPSAANPASTKTIARIFRRLGRYLFYKLVEGRLFWYDVRLATLKSRDYETYDKVIDQIARNFIDNAVHEMDYGDFRVLKDDHPWMDVSDDFRFQIRKLSAARQGIKSDPRADLGLAYFTAMMAMRFPRDASEEEIVHQMLKMLLGWLRDLPLEPDGNPHQILRIKPS